MAMRLTRGLAPRWFTPQGQEGEARPARFQLKPLTGLYKIGLSSCYRGGHFEITEAQARDILQHTLVGWDGVDDEAGHPLPCSREHFDLLPGETVQELLREALESTTLVEEERKNSPSQSPLPASPAGLIASSASGAATATSATPPPSQNG